MTITIEERSAGSGAICRDILATIGDWFGLPASNAAYENLAETGPAVVALDAGMPVGLMMLKRHFDTALEISFIGVMRDRHRQGVGRALMHHAEGRRFLTVKTQGPSAGYEPYERTRRFYQALGYAPLEEFTEIWDAQNPALLMVKAVDR